jgi:hypothetical protein
MTPEEAINAATINGAYVNFKHSWSITVGKSKFYYHQAHSFLLSIALCFCSNLIDTVFLEGKDKKRGARLLFLSKRVFIPKQN